MGVKMTGLDRISRRFDDSELLKRVETAMRRAVFFGADTMVDIIDSSGTDRTWSSPWFGRIGSGRGRVNTGEMRDSVGADVERTRNGVIGEFGWLEGTPYYLKFQEWGFLHAISHEYIEGMDSLRRADQEAFEELMSEIDKIVRDFANGK